MEYIFDIDVSRADGCSHQYLLSSSSDNCLRVYDTENLEVVSTISAHKKTINNIEFSGVSPFLLYSCSSDHSLCLWDTRSPSTPCFAIKVNDEILSFSTALNDSLLAFSLGLSINFFDIRRTTTSTVQRSSQWRLGEYGDIHSDIVTQLKFHPSHPSILASGGEDGLVCLYDVATDSGDEAVLSILNTDAPVRKLGFFGPSSQEGLFALSTTEIPSFWHYPSAQRIAHFPLLRETLSLDYLVNCFFFADDSGGSSGSSRQEGSLYMVAGRYGADEGNETSACVVRVSPNPEVGCNVHTELSRSAHTAMVRCVVASRSHIFTGGEDGKICAWMKSSIEEGGRVVAAPSMSTAVVQHSNSSGHGGNHHIPIKMEEEVVEEEEEGEEPVNIENDDDEEEDEEEDNYRDSDRRKRIRRNDII